MIKKVKEVNGEKKKKNSFDKTKVKSKFKSTQKNKGYKRVEKEKDFFEKIMIYQKKFCSLMFRLFSPNKKQHFF